MFGGLFVSTYLVLEDVRTHCVIILVDLKNYPGLEKNELSLNYF